MAVVRTRRVVAASRITKLARELLDASTLCAIATVGPSGRAHVHTAYFAWGEDFDLVWLSAPEAQHSRNLEANPSVAVAVFDSTQTWGRPDRGIQLFGSASEVSTRSRLVAHRIYAGRFHDFDPKDFGAYRLYRFRPRRMKLFDERALGGGIFVTARVRGGGAVEWAGTERLSSRA